MTLDEIRRKWVILLTIGMVVVLILTIVTPSNISNLSSYPKPTKDYAEAAQRIERLRAQLPKAMNPICQTQFWSHDKKVGRVIVLIHGYTNCPEQFHELGKRFYSLGYNVLIAPLPHHGLADRMTKSHGLLKAEEMTAYADNVVDIAQGLGEEVIIMGFSAGGTITAWAAQNRSDIDLAVMISPVFGFQKIPTPLTATVMNIVSFLPDSFEWWNPKQQDHLPPTYTYPRYSLHALAQILRLGFATQAAVNRIGPRMQLVLNANDNAVNNALTRDITKNWQSQNANFTTYEFDAKLKLGHDLIDPNQPDAEVEIVYPRLIDMVNH